MWSVLKCIMRHKNTYFIVNTFSNILILVSVVMLVLTAMFVFAKTTSAQATSFGASTVVSSATTASSASCVVFTGNLYLGASDRFVSGSNVTRLQNFLISQGYLKVNATGFYGPLTFSAVRNFQRDNGIAQVGGVGPVTRARIQMVSCGTINPVPPVPPTSYAPVINYLSPSSGVIGTTVTIFGSRFDSNTTVNFGSGSSVGPDVRVINSNTLTFRVPEMLLPSCAYPAPGRPFVCMIAGAQTTPGNYQISVKNNNGTSNSATFTVTGSTSSVGAPVINGIDSPSTLSVNQTGTWTVRATDTTGGGLSYSVVWGDESQYAQASAMTSAGATFVQSAVFTHSYTQAGIYTPKFYVRGSNGLTAEVSASVQVTGQVTQSPVITSISPSSGPYGTIVTVYGSGFTRYNNSINYAGRTSVVTNVESSSGTSLQFTIPATPCSAGMMCAQMVMEPGMYQVSVTNQNGTSNSSNFTLTSGSTGSVNQTATIGIGQTVFVNNTNLRIQAVRIVEESRCPSGVYCIQAGRVVIETNIQSGDMIQVANLAYGGNVSNQESVVVDGYTVRIINVTPQARQGGLNSWEYAITYQITR